MSIPMDNIRPMDSMFIRSLASFTETLGLQNAPTIFHLSMLPWNSDADRDAFIQSLTNQNMKERLSYGG